ncbi:MAG: nitrile hydratase accessory protein [Pseudomonadota bacterium]
MTFQSSITTDKPLCDLRFDEPWAARLFGVTIALSEAGAFTLSDFQAALIAAVTEHEKTAPIDNDETYYTCWLQALSALLGDVGLMGPSALSASERHVATRLLELQHHRHEQRVAGEARRIAPLVVA